MVKQTIAKLESLCDFAPQLISALDETEFSIKPSPTQWSKKEIIGHLIDSATNNHQRFVRIQFEETPFISYDQDKWNTFGCYTQANSAQLILFWTTYNKHLAELLKNIPPENYTCTCKVGKEKIVTLEFLIIDYVAHLEHHLHQVINY